MRRKPVITSSTALEIEERARPPSERWRPHKWAIEGPNDPDGAPRRTPDLFISRVAEERMRNHSLSKRDDRIEVMGFMLGSVYKDDLGTYALVRDVATTDLDATSVSVRFEREGFERLFESMDDSCFNYVIVGWYHSHPGHGCFLSHTDIDTQAKMFNCNYHSALVIDPVNCEIAAFCLDEGKVLERAFAVYWEEFQNPYFGESVRARKKKSN